MTFLLSILLYVIYVWGDTLLNNQKINFILNQVFFSSNGAYHISSTIICGQSKVSRQQENDRSSLDSWLPKFLQWNPFEEDRFRNALPNNPNDRLSRAILTVEGQLICNSSAVCSCPLILGCHDILVKSVSSSIQKLKPVSQMVLFSFIFSCFGPSLVHRH